ncbi:MAG: TIGR02996 domain-containing protein [Gemmataceae bacterium]|nr:TIGR02996 domain-containing protein [Gemmataceae bacterium]
MDPILAAICAEPDDDLPRLVWADWLEDRGDPRAEFVRLQMAEHLGEPGDPARCSELLKQFGRKWAGPLADWSFDITWRRGLPDHLVLPAEVFIDLAGPIFELAPVRGVTLLGAARRMRELVRVRELERLRSLHFTGGRIGDSGAAKLAACHQFQNLHTLRLGTCHLSSAALDDLRHNDALAGLRSLDLHDNAIDRWGVRRLAESSAFPMLESLDLRQNDCNEADLKAFRHSPIRRRLVDLLADGPAPLSAIAG